jgi:endo-1,4-beta-xylanase
MIPRRSFLYWSSGVGLSLLLSPSQESQAITIQSPLLKIQAWLPDGTSLGTHALNQLYFLDLNDEPLPNPPRKVEPGILWSQVPSKVPFAIALKLPVTGFGEVVLYADNQGYGYTPRDFPLSLNLACAITRIHRVKVALSKHARKTIPASIQKRLQRAQGMVQRALQPQNLPERIQYCNIALTESLWAGEELAVAIAKQKIGQNPTRPEFRFGCNFFRYPDAGENYTRLFRQLFDFATVPLYWSAFEPQRDQPQFQKLDAAIKWLNKARIPPKGHPLVWFHEAGVPDWAKKFSYGVMKQRLQNRIRSITARYGDRIPYYDIINEAHGVPWANELGYSQDQFLELTQLAAQAARQGHPKAERIVNCCCLWAETVAYQPPPQRSPYQYLKACLQAEIPFEVIGLQLYYPDQDLFEIDRILERFGQLGKPIHITELGVSSATGIDLRSVLKDARGLWHAPWSETIQADWIEQFYTLCYSKPFIQAVTWWDFMDGGNFWPFGGLLTPEGQPKESFRRLQTLLNQWRSQSP